jgi:hypothetical protein
MLVVLIVSASYAKTRPGDKASKVANKVWVIPYTQVAPKIDGLVDSVWNAIDGQPMNYFSCSSQPVLDWSDLSGWCKLLWDENYLYGLFYTMDDFIDSVSTTDWQMDGVEINTDAGNTHSNATTTLSLIPNAYQFCMRPPQKNIDSVEKAYGKGLKFKWFVDTASTLHGGPTGWYTQFQLSLDSLAIVPQAGQKFSLELQQDDNDGSGRIHISKWWNSTKLDDDWQNTYHWGDAVLGDAVTGEEVDANYSYVFLKTSKPPALTAETAVDGYPTDPAWDDANQLVSGNKGVGASWPVSPQDNDFRFYGLYDDNNIYGFFIVYDDYVDSTSTTDWQMDGVEVSTDAGNTHSNATTTLSLIPNAYQFCMRPPQKNIDSVEKAYGKGLKFTWKDLPNTGNDSVFSSMTGWACQFQLSIDSLAIVPQEGTKFSFELQTDDNDGAGRIHITKWWNTSLLDDDWQNTYHWGNAVLGPNEVLGVKGKPAPVVNTYKLEQNYPNPFNPTTQIKYSVAQTGFVTLKVYNVLGQQVSTLFSGVRKAGQDYTATFDGSRLSSGVYFYKLEAGNQMLVKKLMLLK